jgi:mRNA interferase HicA
MQVPIIKKSLLACETIRIDSLFNRTGLRIGSDGGWHSWWHHPAQNKRSAIAKHSEIKDILANKICKDLGVKPLK